MNETSMRDRASSYVDEFMDGTGGGQALREQGHLIQFASQEMAIARRFIAKSLREIEHHVPSMPLDVRYFVVQAIKNIDLVTKPVRPKKIKKTKKTKKGTSA